MDDLDRIEEAKNWMATRTAWLDQKKKQFYAQYDMVPPFANKRRMDDLEACDFAIDIHRWELGEIIKSMGEEE